MNEQTERQIANDARSAARYSRWAVQWDVTAMAVFSMSVAALWFAIERASAEAVAPFAERVAAVEARVEATDAAQAATAIAAESVAIDVQAMRIMFEQRVVPLETEHGRPLPAKGP